MSENEIVKQLYMTSWSQVSDSVQKLVRSEQEAQMLVKALTQHRGWRERVTAAKIVAAYKLNELAPQLVATFHKGPEYYTCRAFTRMIAETLGSDGIQLLGEMKRSCHSDDYGNNMIKVINEEGLSTASRRGLR
jgi:hypothetical protein